MGQPGSAPERAARPFVVLAVVQQQGHVQRLQHVDKAAHVVQIGVAVAHGRQTRRIVCCQSRRDQSLAGVKSGGKAAPAVQKQAHVSGQA